MPSAIKYLIYGGGLVSHYRITRILDRLGHRVDHYQFSKVYIPDPAEWVDDWGKVETGL